MYDLYRFTQCYSYAHYFLRLRKVFMVDVIFYLMRIKGYHSDYTCFEVNMPPLVLRAKCILVGELLKL